jgi:hypothetical protein
VRQEDDNDLLGLQRNFVDFTERNTSVNAVYYASILHILHDAIKRRGILSSGVHLLHDNAPVQAAAVAKAALKECGFQ